MNARIFINGRQAKDALFIIDSLNREIYIATPNNSGRNLDTGKVYAEVRVFGDIRGTQPDMPAE